MDRFDAIAAFVAVADHRGFAPAARALRVSPSAITRLVAGLEERLGVRLLNRTTRAVRLTDSGARFLDRARRLLADLDEAERVAESERAVPSGRLTVTAPAMFGRLHVTPLIMRYLALNPAVDVRLDYTDRIVNLVEEGIDAAVRIGAFPDSGDIARRLGQTRRVVAAAPGYLRDHPAPATPEAVTSHRVVDFGPTGRAERWRFWRAGQAVDVAVAPRVSVNDAAAAVWAAVEGQGLVMAFGYQVAAEVASGALRVVLAEFEPPPVLIRIVYPSSRLLSVKVRALVDVAAATVGWDF